jgi:DNA-directed RNA polymerase specialized sigma24 family protein
LRCPLSKIIVAIPNNTPVQRDLLYEMIGIERSSRSTSMFSDAELARAAQVGDATSPGILLERHRAPLYAAALRMLGHGPQAKDAIQDAFVIAPRSIDRLREPEAVGGWLHGILRNVCLWQLRARRDESSTGRGVPTLLHQRLDRRIQPGRGL